MKEGETVNENETVNQSQSAAGGSGEKPEKLVADHVENLWEHIAADGYDLLADVAVESLTRNGDVPPDAYLRSVKMSWCLHRAAVYYARQYSVERVSADFARGDAQFEHSLRAQAERKAEKLEADLAQSSLLVESQRLRIEEARAQGAEWCEEINKLKGSLGARREELTASFTANQELRQKLETAEAALLEQQQRNEELVTQNSQQFMKIAGLQRQVEGAKTQELEGKTQELQAEYTPPEGWRLLQTGETLTLGDIWVRPDDDAMFQTVHVGSVVGVNRRYIRQIDPEVVQPAKITPPEGWQLLEVGEIEPEVVQPLMLQDADVGIRMLRQCNQNQYEKIVSMREELNQVKGELAGAIQSRDLLAETNREQAGKIEHLQRQVEALTIIGL